MFENMLNVSGKQIPRKLRDALEKDSDQLLEQVQRFEKLDLSVNRRVTIVSYVEAIATKPIKSLVRTAYAKKLRTLLTLSPGS